MLKQKILMGCWFLSLLSCVTKVDDSVDDDDCDHFLLGDDGREEGCRDAITHRNGLFDSGSKRKNRRAPTDWTKKENVQRLVTQKWKGGGGEFRVAIFDPKTTPCFIVESIRSAGGTFIFNEELCEFSIDGKQTKFSNTIVKDAASFKFDTSPKRMALTFDVNENGRKLRCRIPEVTSGSLKASCRPEVEKNKTQKSKK